MALRVSGASQYYTSAAGLPTTRLWTMSLWVQLVSDRNLTTLIVSLDSSTSQYAYLGTQTDGTQLIYDWPGSPGTSITNGGQMTIGTWYRVAIVVNGNAATLYQATVTASSLTVYNESASFALPTGTLTLGIGGSNAYGASNWPDVRIAAFKMWDAALSQTEVDNELETYVPQRTANISRWHPFVRTESADYSGRGRTLSGGANSSTEDGPPIAWRRAKQLTIPWDPTSTIWYAVYIVATGELFSVGTTVDLQAGQAYKTYVGFQPDQVGYEWNPVVLDFVHAPGPELIDRVSDLVNDATLASAWADLSPSDSTAMQDRIGQMLGPYRYRKTGDSADL